MTGHPEDPGQAASIESTGPGEAAGLRRLHPFTPLLRSWQTVGVVTAIMLAALGDDPDRLVWVWNALQGEADLPLLLRASLVVLAVGVVLLGAGWVSWRLTGFALRVESDGSGTLLYHRGVLVRQRSRVRLDRVQSVDVLQPLVPRLLGLAVVSLDMAAGAEASVKLAYLREADAWQLRDEILRHTATRRGAAAAASPAGTEPVPPSPDEELVGRVSTNRLIQAALLEGSGVWLFTFVVVLVMVGVALVNVAAVVALLPVAVSLGIALLIAIRRQAETVFREANFSLLRTRGGGGIRVSSGLLSTVNRTVELDRVQEVRIVEPWTWRWYDWARVEVDVAGSARTEATAPAATLMPVADRAEAVGFVVTLLGADLDEPQLARPGAGARWLDPIGYGFLGVGLLHRGALTRLGRWRRTRVFVPYARVQSVSVRQGWLQRRLGVATVHLDMPTGVRRWTAPHRDAAEARRLVDELVRRARRQRAVPWSEPAGDTTDAGADDEHEHDHTHRLGLAVQHGPGQQREPADEGGDDAQRGQGGRQRSGQPGHHQEQDQTGDRQRW